MPIYLKTSTATNSWRKATSLYLKTSTATNSWRKIVSAYIKTNDGWKSLFSSIVIPSIQTRVEVSSSGGINAGSTIMNDSSPITLTSTRYHWLNADGFTYIWQKSPNNATWTNIGTEQSTTNPAIGSSSSSITKTLSSSDFTSGSDMYFRFVFYATNSTSGTSNSSESLPILISYYGTPTPAPGSPSITGSTVVGNTASGNIGTWTNSPTSYDYRVYYTSGLTSYPLTYAGVKSVSNKFLSGFSAALVTSASHGYKVDDTVVVSGMDSLFNGSHTITAKTNNTIYFILPTPTAYSLTSSYSAGSFISFVGYAYIALSSLPASSAWTDAGTGYSVGDNVYYNSNRYRANSSLSGVSPFNGGTLYSAGAIVYSGTNRYQSNLNNNIGNSVTNTTWWTNLGSFAPGSNSMWTTVMPSNSSYWTLQYFSDTPTSGTTTAPNYYEGTVYSSTSIPIPITTFAYKENIDLRGATTSGTGAVLNFGVKAYNQATFSPSEYLGTAFIYGVPILSIGSITPVYTTASVPFTSSYMSSYLLNLYTQPSITNVAGGSSTVTYFAANTFTSGQQVTITGVNPSQYNVTTTIQSANSTSFTISANITGAYVSGGTAKVTVSGYPLTVSSNTSPRSITGLSQGTTYYLEMTPVNSGTTGTMQTSSFTTLIQPTISNISVASSTVAPGSASSVSVGNSGTTNVGSVSWANGSNTSSAWLSSVSGAGSGGITDPGSPFTTGTFTITSTGTANVNIRAVNKQKTASVTWAQTNAQSYLISYDISGAVGNPQVATGNSSASNPSVVLVSDTVARTVTLRSITVYPNLDQGGTGVNLVSTASATSADSAFTNTSGSGSVTFSSPPATPTITYSNVTSGGFTVSWSSSGATSYNVQIYQTISGTNVSGYPLNGTTNTSAVVSGLSPNLGYSTTITAINTAGTALNTVSTTTLKNPALTPTFGGNTSNIGGFTGSVTNYDGTNYVWGISTNAGSVSWGTASGSTRPFTVTGLSTTSAQSATVTVTTTRNNYFDGSAQTTGSSRAPVLYTVFFDANGADSGSAIPTSRTQTTEGGSIVIATQGTLVRSGYTFGGFNTNTAGTGTNYAVGASYTPTSNVTLYARWTLTPVASVSAIRGSTGGRTGTTFWNDPKSTMVYTFANVTSATARIQRSTDNVNWTSGVTEALSISSNTATQTTNQPTGNTSASANYYYRAQVISLNGVTLGSPITSASIQNTITPKSNISLYP